MKPITVEKYGAIFRLSEEQLFEAAGHTDPRFQRRAKIIKTPPAPEAWELYRAAVAGLAALEAYEGTYYGMDAGTPEVFEPEPTSTVEYLETVDDWLARCRTLAQEDVNNRKTARRLDPNP